MTALAEASKTIEEATVHAAGFDIVCRRVEESASQVLALSTCSGFRSEHVGTVGYAHLVEHLLFRARTLRLDESVHASLEAVGGYSTAVTRPDSTTFLDVVPYESPDALLERSLRARLSVVRFDRSDIENALRVIEHEVTTRHAANAYSLDTWRGARDLAFLDAESSHDGYPAHYRPAVTADSLLNYYRQTYLNRRVSVVASSPDPASGLAERLAECLDSLDLRPDTEEPAAPRLRARSLTEDLLDDDARGRCYGLLALPTPEPVGDPALYLAVKVILETVLSDFPARVQDGRALAKQCQGMTVRWGQFHQIFETRFGDLATAEYASSVGAAARGFTRGVAEALRALTMDDALESATIECAMRQAREYSEKSGSSIQRARWLATVIQLYGLPAGGELRPEHILRSLTTDQLREACAWIRSVPHYARTAALGAPGDLR
ncbi:insulinase family protein [Streptomyces monashensis]|uniref:Peptidase M16 N-terminal domain-containing protein n=1 Tax=Streptomyces monashensis TaxID=1678012 RepID=A0A1S2PKW8_9ACTN|nr:insulinase family protein [Streptomyces monashensis]OIJ93604.1 hypothetical protein BIV23_37265 [Streptomyces monashensis]